MKPQFLNARKGGRATEEIALRRGEKFMRDIQNQAYILYTLKYHK